MDEYLVDFVKIISSETILGRYFSFRLIIKMSHNGIIVVQLLVNFSFKVAV